MGLGNERMENFETARYNTNGTLDTSFDGNGLQTTDFGGVEDLDTGRAVAIQPDGRIVVAGTTDAGTDDADFALARYHFILPLIRTR